MAVRGMADGNVRVMLAHDAAHEPKCAAWRVSDDEVRPRPPMDGGSVDMSHAKSCKGKPAMSLMPARRRVSNSAAASG